MASSLTLYCAITAENGSRVPITVSSASITPTQLRLQASEATKIPLAQLRLIFRGRMIKDDTSLDAVKEYKLEDECVLHCMGKPNKDGDPASSDPQPAAAAASAPTISAAAPPASTINTTTTTTTTTASAAAPPQDPLQEALEQLRTNARSPDVYTTAISTLDKILDNIIDNPMEEKYRKVKVHNAAFGKRLGNLVGGRQAVLGVGFQQTTDESGTQIYLMEASADAWPALQKAKETLEQAVAQAKRASAAAPPPHPFATTGMPNNSSRPNPAAAGMQPNPMAASMAEDILSNPEAFQNMMQNPMVQQMIQNDPNIPPHVRQSIQSLGSNPAMMNQLSQMMNDPMVRSQMQSALGSGGGIPNMGGGIPNMMGNPAPGSNNNNATSNNTTTSNANNSGNDQSQTEEEMIAEAIRRSLEEG